MIHLVGHALGLAILALLIAAPGRALASRLGPLPPSLHLAAVACCGLATWTVFLFTLAASSLLHPPVLAACAIALTLCAALPSGRAQQPTPRVSRRDPTLPLVVALLLAPSALLAANPTVSWDAAVYHLALPRLELTSGAFAAPPMLVYAHWPRGVELLYTLALWLGDIALGGSHIVAKLTHWGFGLLTVLTLARAGSTRHSSEHSARSTLGWLAAGLFVLNGVVLFELQVAYIDVAMAFFALVTFLAACTAADAATRRRRDAALLLAGLGAALLTGAKLTGFVVAGCMLLPLAPSLLAEASRRGALAALRPLLARVVLPVVAVAGAWAAKAWWSTGNPVYPLLYGLFGGTDWSADLSRRLTAWQRGIGMGREPLDYLLLPWRVVVDGDPGYDRFDGRLSLAWLVALPAALWTVVRARLAAHRPASDPLVGRALAASGAYFVFWAASAQQMRFLIPVLPLLALAGAAGLVALGRHLSLRRSDLRRLGPSLAALGLLVVFVTEHRALAASGARHLALYLSRPVAATATRPPVFEVAATLPENARLLLLGTNQIFYSPRPSVADSFFEASQIADWLGDAENPRAVAARLAERGLTHVVWTAGAETIYPRHLVTLLGDARFARPLWRDGRHMLLALEPIGPLPVGGTR
ncbi:MAG: hypothetical protein AAGC60_11680 [Acidobacteriota bacterium]